MVQPIAHSLQLPIYPFGCYMEQFTILFFTFNSHQRPDIQLTMCIRVHDNSSKVFIIPKQSSSMSTLFAYNCSPKFQKRFNVLRVFANVIMYSFYVCHHLLLLIDVWKRSLKNNCNKSIVYLWSVYLVFHIFVYPTKATIKSLGGLYSNVTKS